MVQLVNTKVQVLKTKPQPKGFSVQEFFSLFKFCDIVLSGPVSIPNPYLEKWCGDHLVPINLMRPCVRDVQSQRLNHALNLTHCPLSPPENHLDCEHPLIHFLNIDLEERESMCYVIEPYKCIIRRSAEKDVHSVSGVGVAKIHCTEWFPLEMVDSIPSWL